MWTRRAVMATTSLVGLAASAWGLPGRGMDRGFWEGLSVEWTWRVLSQEAEMRRAGGRGRLAGCGCDGREGGWAVGVCLQCSLLYTTQRTGAACVLMTVCSPVARLSLWSVALALAFLLGFAHIAAATRTC